MRILGIDPGYAIVGYGAIESGGSRYRPLAYGAILTEAGDPFEKRLEIIYDDLTQILTRWTPAAAAIERLYFHTNQKTVIEVAEARGTILLALKKADVPFYEYTPLQVKTAVTGYGHADKKQVMEMTRRLLRLKELPRPDDAADALAIAICHGQSAGSVLIKERISGGK
jgi:crossover junction endodeoxyribonuclease RuvC